MIGVTMKYILTLLVFSNVLFASTLDGLIKQALQKSTLIQQAKANSELSSLKVQESRASRYGELGVVGDATHYNIERTLAPLTPSAIGSGQPITTSDDIFSLGLSYSLPLFTGFAQTRQVEMDALASHMAEIKLSLTKEQLIYNIRTLYLAILTQEEILLAQKKYTSTLKKLSKQIGYEVKLGKKAQIDLLKSEADYQASKTKEAILKTNIKTTKATLSSLVGEDVSVLEPIMIAVKEPHYSLDALYETSATLGKIQSQELAIKKAEKMISKSKSANLPQVNLASYLGKNYGEDIKTNDWDNETLWQVGVNLKYNLLDFGKRDAGVQKAKIAALQARLNKEQTLLDLKKLLIESIGNIEQSYAQFQGNATQLALSEKSGKIEKVRYENGVATLNDLLLAQSKTLLAKAKVIESKYGYQKNVYYLDYVLERSSED